MTVVKRRRWVTVPLLKDCCLPVLACPSEVDPVGAATRWVGGRRDVLSIPTPLGTDAASKLATVSIPTGVFDSPAGGPSLLRGLARLGWVTGSDTLVSRGVGSSGFVVAGGAPVGIVRAEVAHDTTGRKPPIIRVVVRGRRVTPLDRVLADPVEASVVRVAEGSRARSGDVRYAVPWDRLRACAAVGGVRCGLSVCPSCGLAQRQRAVVGRAHGLATMASDWGMDLCMVTLSSRYTLTDQSAREHKLGASAVLGAISPAGRWLSETKNKGCVGPSCCEDPLCLNCGGLGRMQAQHLHVHALCLLPRLDYSRLHSLLAEASWQPWIGLNVQRSVDGSHAAAYLSGYLTSDKADPWCYVRLRRMLGSRWGESWGAVRGATATVRRRLPGGAVAYAVAVADVDRPDSRWFKPERMVERLRRNRKEYERGR